MFKRPLFNKIKKFIIKNHLYICSIILFFYLLPLLFLWEDIPALIHDNLDSTVIYWKILAESNEKFADNDAIVPNMMNGLPRASYGSEFNFMILFFYLFPPFVAYMINQILIPIFAFFGMYLLLKNHFNITHNKFLKIIIIDGVALSFAFLPFWTPAGLSVAGLPLILYAFLNFRFNKITKFDWMILTFIPFYSLFVFSSIFFIAIIFLIFLKDWIIQRNFNKIFFLALVYFGLISFIIEYRLILSFFDNSFISHRSEFIPEIISFSDAVSITLYNFIEGHYHSAGLHKYFVFYSLLIAILGFIVLKIIKKEDYKEIKPKIKLLIKLCTVSGIFALFIGFSNWEGLSFLNDLNPVFYMFQWDRFYILAPVVWYIIFAIALDLNVFLIKKSKIMENCLIKINEKQNRLNIKIEHIIVSYLTILIGLQCVYIVGYFNQSYIKIYNSVRYGKDYISYKEFYAEEQFKTIKSDIGLPQEDYLIGCIGFQPAVAQYNGYYTIDGYNINYPLEYKHQFRYLISKELEKSPKYTKNFDPWGSRCYIFVAEIGEITATKSEVNIYKWYNIEIENLELNTTTLKDLGTDFIFSSLPINNHNDNNLTLFNEYDHENSIWKIYVYNVD